MTRETTDSTFDLLIIPQLGETIPGPHLTPEEIEHVRTDWHRYGTETILDPDGHWHIATAHATPAGLTITSVVTIPRATAAPTAA